MARGEGLEPSITGPEPAVLPITPPPNAPTISVGQRDAYMVTGIGFLVIPENGPGHRRSSLPLWDGRRAPRRHLLEPPDEQPPVAWSLGPARLHLLCPRR